MEPSPQRRARLMWRAVRVHARHSPWHVAGWLFGNVVTSAMPVGISWSFGLTVGGVPGAVERGMSSPAGRQLVLGLVAMVIMDLVHAPCSNLAWRCAELGGIRHGERHRQRIMRTLLDRPGVAHMHDPAVLDAARAADNVWVKGLLEGIGSVASHRLRGSLAAGLVCVQHLPAGLVLGGVWLVYARWAWHRATADASAVTDQAQLLRRSEALHGMAVSAATAKEVRLFALGGFFRRRFVDEWWRAMGTIWDVRRDGGRGAAWMSMLLVAAHTGAFWMVSSRAAAGALTVTALATALQAGMQTSALGAVPHGHYEVEYGLVTLPNLDRLERVVAQRAEPMTGSVPATPPRRAIRFEDVRFAYPGSGKEVLAGLDLEIPAGSSLAIVGANGAGKTTLVQLLSRLRDPTGGRIAADGTDLRSFDASSWQRTVAAVSQTSMRLPLSVRENLTCGRDVSEAAMRRALGAAGAAAIVDALPDGLDSVVDRGLPRGVELSGGQWQRLALARALCAMEAGADVLVLDEPTAHMDARAEADLYDRFLEITRGRTTVLVSHRFSTVRRADRIVVLSHGRVTEQGTHEELVALGGYYARAFRVQAARFATEVSA